ncbi:MAG: transketolase [Fimbriimonadales bacterium]
MPTGEAVETQLTLNTIRGLSMDAVQAANSGHPGLPMGAAAMGYALFARHLRFDPEAPEWFNRDRFILSAGHGSMLLYSLLYLTGYDLSLEDIKNFRQWGSKTPGHPENFMTPGVEMATGPLGQGFATGVGMAIAEEMLRAEFPVHVGHWTYAICSDGDLMEGVSHEAASLAGHLQLGRLVYLYDSNRVTIDGKTDLTYSDDVAGRFAAYGWHVSKCDGMDVDQVDQRIAEAKGDERPSLIVCTTTIGYGSPNKADSEQSHGSPLGIEEVKTSKIALGIPLEPHFLVPGEVRERMLKLGTRCRQERIASESKIDEALKKRLAGEMDHSWERHLPVFEGAMATRASSGKIINAISKGAQQLVGGSADLTESNQTEIIAGDTFSAGSRMGRNIHFGVREHAMACALNGLNLHGGFRAFGGTFLIFSDYMRPAVRLAALMQLSSIFVFTHDSIGLGEDGPTHQPIEHLMGLRAIPNLAVFRPADANETAAAWKIALERNRGPTALVLTRQPVPPLSPGIEGGLCGGYVLREASSDPRVILVATGSEVSICVDAREMLEAEGIPTRVVSIPCWELFGEQPQEYRDSVLPPSVTARVSVEAGATLGWERWIGSSGKAIGLDHFGASAPYKRIYEEFGLTAERVADTALSLV